MRTRLGIALLPDYAGFGFAIKYPVLEDGCLHWAVTFTVGPLVLFIQRFAAS